MLILYLAIGGVAGTLARYGLATWVYSWSGTGFPWGTLAVNTIGSFLIGFLFRYLEGVAAAPELRGLLTIGLLGAFTTFSTFSYETAALIQDAQWARAALYSLGSVLLGLAAVFAGLMLAGLVLQPRG